MPRIDPTYSTVQPSRRRRRRPMVRCNVTQWEVGNRLAFVWGGGFLAGTRGLPVRGLRGK
jgi:hypothetical protein